VVLADSDVRFSDLSKVENHLLRPEIQQALHGHDSWVIRHSHTVDRDLLYQSVPIPSKSGPLGVLRLAVNLDSVQNKLDHARSDIWLMSLAAGLAGLLIVIWISWSIRRRLEELTVTAEKLSQGHFDARVLSQSADEFGTLGGTLNYLGQKIQQTIEDLSRDKTQLSAILSNMVESVVAVNQAGRIVAINTSLCRLVWNSIRMRFRDGRLWTCCVTAN
jgi:two-component system phosphate regulon sensor histidine kinase PhoR